MAQRANNFDIGGEQIPPEDLIFGRTETMAAVRRNLRKVADTNIPVLLEGESGTGKEVVCKFLHRNSSWGQGSFVKVSCPAIPGTLLESELFGYEGGAFTGAISAHAGHSALVSRGTFFLDEISELDPSLQSKLLRVLQDGQMQTPAVAGERQVDVRVVCATSRRLQKEVAAGKFREDLYYRISGLVVRLPALRERLEDLDDLAGYFTGLYNQRFGCSAPPLSQSTLMHMTTHPWTGNIRELENLIRRYVVVGSEEAILSELGERSGAAGQVEALPVGGLSLSQLTRNAMHTMESRIILDTLRANQWNRRRTARALKISYRSLMYKLKRSGIQNGLSAGSEGRTLGDLS